MKSSMHLSSSATGETEFFPASSGEVESAAVQARKRRRVNGVVVMRSCARPKVILSFGQGSGYAITSSAPVANNTELPGAIATKEGFSQEGITFKVWQRFMNEH